MRELQADEKAVERAECGPVGVVQLAKQSSEAGAIRFGGERLIWVRAAIGPDRGGLTTPDEFCSAEAEVMPAAKRVRAGSSVAARVPTFHRMNAPTIADGQAGDVDWLRKWRTFGCRQDFVVNRQRKAQLVQPAAERGDVFQLSDFGISSMIGQCWRERSEVRGRGSGGEGLRRFVMITRIASSTGTPLYFTSIFK